MTSLITTFRSGATNTTTIIVLVCRKWKKLSPREERDNYSHTSPVLLLLCFILLTSVEAEAVRTRRRLSSESQWPSQKVLLPIARQSRSCSCATDSGSSGGRATRERGEILLVEAEDEVEEEGWTERERADGMKTFTLSVSTSQRSRICVGEEEEDDDDAWKKQSFKCER